MSVGLALALVLGGCGQSPPTTAKATPVSSQGEKVGKATLTQTPEGVKIVMKVENLPPGEQAERAAAPGPHFEEQFHCASQCAPVGVAWENLTTALVRLQAASMDELPEGPPRRPQKRTTIHIISSVDQHRPVRHTPAGSTLCP